MTPELFLSIVKDSGQQKLLFRMGSIPSNYVSGRPSIVFDGETTASIRTYPYLSSYTPAPDDRVLIAMVATGGVILGKIV